MTCKSKAVFRVVVTFLCGFCIGFMIHMLGYEAFMSANAPQGTEDMAEVKYSTQASQWGDMKSRAPRVLCYLLLDPYTHRRAIHVKNTWGKRCDKTIYFSTEEDGELKSTPLKARKGYQYLWDKSKKALEYLRQNHADFDWYFKGDHDTYVIVENLKSFLKNRTSSDPVYFGLKFKILVKQGYMSGGGGYVFSQEALRRVVDEGIQTEGNSKCRSLQNKGAEDVNIGLCFESVGVMAGESHDSEGLPRFFAHDPQSLFFKTNLVNKAHWYWKYIDKSHDLGLGCCSDYLISFHSVEPRMMWTIEGLLYKIKVSNGSYS